MKKHPGYGTRYDQQAELEEKARRNSNEGYYKSYICEICKKARCHGNHSKCSKILQQIRIAEDTKKKV